MKIHEFHDFSIWQIIARGEKEVWKSKMKLDFISSDVNIGHPNAFANETETERVYSRSTGLPFCILIAF